MFGWSWGVWGSPLFTLNKALNKMTIQTLQRVMWRLRSKHPKTTKIQNNELRRAVMVECGTSHVTYIRNRKSLKDLGWIRTSKTYIELTGADLTGEY